MTSTTASEQFVEAVRRLRERYQLKVESSAFTRPLAGIESVVVDDIVRKNYWIQHDDGHILFLSLADIPCTLSGDILRLERNLPDDLQRKTTGAYSITGDDIRVLSYVPPIPEDEDDSEDVSAGLALLPLVPVDPKIHFLKKSKYTSEIRNHLACLGGTCPGTPLSPHILPLLGKSPAGELVFPMLTPDVYILWDVHPLASYKAWLLDLIDGLCFLHARGIVHRDICARNLLWSDGNGGVLIGDLEGHWGRRDAPEFRARMLRIPMAHDAEFDNVVAGWTFMSDVYDVGEAIVHMLYAADPRGMAERPVPPPLDAIVAACMRALPEDRPSLEELRVMVERIACD